VAGPIVDVRRFSLQQPPLHDAVVEPIELDLHMPRRHHGGRAAELLELIIAVGRVQILEMHRVGRVVHALEPVAGQQVDLDDLVEIIAHQNVPARDQRDRLRTEIGENQPAQLRDRIGLDGDLVLVAVLGERAILERLLQAAALGVEKPAVIGAAQALLVRNAVFHGQAAVRTAIADEPHSPRSGTVEGEVLAEQPDLLHRFPLELGRGADRRH
jgi:hypothetical protein